MSDDDLFDESKDDLKELYEKNAEAIIIEHNLTGDNIKICKDYVWNNFLDNIYQNYNLVPRYNTPLQEREIINNFAFNEISMLKMTCANNIEEEKQVYLNDINELTTELISKIIFFRDQLIGSFKRVKEALIKMEDNILEIQNATSWRAVIYDVEDQLKMRPLWVITQDKVNNIWRAYAVAESYNNFLNRTLVDPELRGLSKTALAEKLQISDRKPFVHHTGFTAGADSKTDLLKIIKYKSVDSTAI